MAVSADPASSLQHLPRWGTRSRIARDDPARLDVLCGGRAMTLGPLLASLLGDARRALDEITPLAAPARATRGLNSHRRHIEMARRGVTVCSRSC
jgi:hypothetical protein